eukprot:1368756-Pleurochrysis_carterae.AAC.3
MRAGALHAWLHALPLAQAGGVVLRGSAGDRGGLQALRRLYACAHPGAPLGETLVGVRLGCGLSEQSSLLP